VREAAGIAKAAVASVAEIVARASGASDGLSRVGVAVLESAVIAVLARAVVAEGPADRSASF